MNTWNQIKRLCQQLFGFTPTINQLRLWYFGTSYRYGDIKKNHRQQVEGIIGPWDLVIQLACHYTKQEIINSRRHWSNEEIVKFIYYLVWSDYQLFITQKKKDGTTFEAPTFWNWALENKNKTTAKMSPAAAKNFKQVLQEMLKKMEG